MTDLQFLFNWLIDLNGWAQIGQSSHMFYNALIENYGEFAFLNDTLLRNITRTPIVEFDISWLH